LVYQCFPPAFDLRALQLEFIAGLDNIVSEELTLIFNSSLSQSELTSATNKVCSAVRDALETTSTMDATDRMQKVAASSTTVLVDIITGPAFPDAIAAGSALTSIPAFRAQISCRASALLDQLRRDYLSGQRGTAPASLYLHKTRPMYEFIRLTLGIKMHGSENYTRFIDGLGVEDVTVGQNISLIHEVGPFSVYSAVSLFTYVS
jgi:phenylalanine ammonia-lyase